MGFDALALPALLAGLAAFVAGSGSPDSELGAFIAVASSLAFWAAPLLPLPAGQSVRFSRPVTEGEAVVTGYFLRLALLALGALMSWIAWAR